MRLLTPTAAARLDRVTRLVLAAVNAGAGAGRRLEPGTQDRRANGVRESTSESARKAFAAGTRTVT
jgi:hypothetical protein